MLSRETETLVRLATESLKKDLLVIQKAQADIKEVPCGSGLRDFKRLTELYWVLSGALGHGRAERCDQIEACEAQCEPARHGD